MTLNLQSLFPTSKKAIRQGRIIYLPIRKLRTFQETDGDFFPCSVVKFIIDEIRMFKLFSENT